MNKIIGCAAIAFAVASMPASADAKGCIKGALVGGVAGHYAGYHGVLGAAAGCVIGHHEANKPARQNKDLQQHRRRIRRNKGGRRHTTDGIWAMGAAFRF